MNASLSRLNPGIMALVIAVLMLGGCKTTAVVPESALPVLSEAEILEKVREAEYSYGEINARLSVSVRSERQNGQFRVNLRMAEDSLIWMSIVPALGIEAARALISQDSIKFIDKLKDRYYLADIAMLDSVMGHGMEFGLLQNLLVGNPLEIADDEKYVALSEGSRYLLQTLNPRKLRKALDLDPKNPSADSSISDVVNVRKYERALDKFEGEDLIIKRYYIRGEDFRVQRSVIEYLESQRTIIIAHSHFEDVAGGALPMETHVQINTPSESAEFELKFSRIRTVEDQDYPFKIPENYAPLR